MGFVVWNGFCYRNKNIIRHDVCVIHYFFKHFPIPLLCGFPTLDLICDLTYKLTQIIVSPFYIVM
jgi:hypothetical protein